MSTIARIRELAAEQGRDRATLASAQRERRRALDRVQLIESGGWSPNPPPWDRAEWTSCCDTAHRCEALIETLRKRLAERAPKITALIRERRVEKGRAA